MAAKHKRIAMSVPDTSAAPAVNQILDIETPVYFREIGPGQMGVHVEITLPPGKTKTQYNKADGNGWVDSPYPPFVNPTPNPMKTGFDIPMQPNEGVQFVFIGS